MSQFAEKIGLLFPGQGSQYVGMGKDLYEELPEAKRIMDEANNILDFDIKSMIFEGSEDNLVKTEIAQPAIFIVSAMYFEKFKQQGESFEIVAGHSLGEYSALYAAGVLSFEDGLRLVRKRGLAMSRGTEAGAMYAVMGLSLERAEKLITEYGKKVSIANINSKMQLVLSGPTNHIDKLAFELSKYEGITIKKLNVSGAFHSPLMVQAKDAMQVEIEKTYFGNPKVEIVPNVLGYATKDAIILKQVLIEQITGQIKWLDTIQYMKKDGITQLYEVGPGDVLKKLNQTIVFKPKCNNLL